MSSKFKNIKPYILLIPALFILLGVFLIGLYMGLLQSLGYFPAVGLEDITLDYYREVFLNKDFLSSLRFSLFISTVSSALAVLIGVSFAYLMVRRERENKLLQVIYKLPIVVPHLVVALIVYTLFSQSGIFARILFNLGIISSQTDFPNLIYDRRGIGIIIAYVWKGTPFIAMVTYGILKNLSSDLVEAGRNLGASEGQVFINILLPLSLPTISSSFIILFAYSFGAFEIPFLLGATAPRALPVLSYVEYMNPDWTNRAYAMTINMVLAGISLTLISLYSLALKKIKKYGR